MYIIPIWYLRHDAKNIPKHVSLCDGKVDVFQKKKLPSDL